MKCWPFTALLTFKIIFSLGCYEEVLKFMIECSRQSLAKLSWKGFDIFQSKCTLYYNVWQLNFFLHCNKTMQFHNEQTIHKRIIWMSWKKYVIKLNWYRIFEAMLLRQTLNLEMIYLDCSILCMCNISYLSPVQWGASNFGFFFCKVWTNL